MHTLNPVSRILQIAQHSEKDFREVYGFSKQFMVDVTEGTYTQLSDRVHRSLRELCQTRSVHVPSILRDDYEGAATLDEAYEKWQRWQRIQNADTFMSTKPRPGTPELSPAHFFVKDSARTPTTFSKKLKVPPQTVRNWITGATKKEIPGAIRGALHQIGYPYIAELQRLHGEWVDQ